MKNNVLLTLVLTMILSTSCFADTNYTDKSILGVWKLTKFVTTDENGNEEPWCEGVHGSIAYLPGLMSVSINCESFALGSGAAKLSGHLFYSGPFEIDTKSGEVIHRVRNFSHESLHKIYRRKVVMSDENNLKLLGELGAGKTVVVEWVRIEKFSYDNSALTGVYELTGSENQVEGSDNTIPFCNGFYGTILYTPGGYTAVSINCGEKKDPNTTEPADQFGRSFFYSGEYKQLADVLIQTPANASESKLIGKPAKRQMRINGDLLILEGVNGSKFKATWRKLQSFVGL